MAEGAGLSNEEILKIIAENNALKSKVKTQEVSAVTC